MNHGSLFSGIGGFDLAAEWMGWQNVFHCEWNEFDQKVLNYYWPNAISYNDITKTDFPTQSPVRGRDDGLPGRLDGITFSKWRNESIKAYGNAIVPQVALQIFKAIEAYNNLTPKP